VYLNRVNKILLIHIMFSFGLGCASEHSERNNNFIEYKDSTKFLNEFSFKYFQIANKYKKLKKFSIAEDYYKKSIDLDSCNNVVMLNLGNLYSIQGRYIEAKYWYLKIIKRDTTYSPAYFNLAELSNQLHEYENAIEYAHRSINLIKTREDMYPRLITISYAYIMLGSCDSAKKYFEEYKKNVPQSSPAFDFDYLFFYTEQCEDLKSL